MNPPAAIVYVNSNISESVKSLLVRQLHLTDIQDGYDFDGYTELNPAYPDDLRTAGERVMVLRNDFADRADNLNWTAADIVLFIKHGLAAVEYNKFGPPKPQMALTFLTWFRLGVLPY